MPLEATMILMDNSEWNRNGDLPLSRWECQQDAAQVIIDSKTQQNPESTIGVMSIAGRRIEIKITGTNIPDDAINAVNNIEINGEGDVVKSIKIAQLSLKNRLNRSARQRIIAFIGHPLEGNEEDYEELGMRLKKNGVAIDVINFCNSNNVSRLQTLIQAADAGSGTCHFLDIPQDSSAITPLLFTSPIIQGDDMGMNDQIPGGLGQNNNPLDGIDPNMDPELAAAIRMSMEEARQQEQVNLANNAAQNQPQVNAPGVQPGLAAAANDDDGMYDDLQDDDERALAEALALSKMPASNAQVEENKAQQPSVVQSNPAINVTIDEDFMKDVIGDLGIDLDDSQLGDLVNQANKKEEKKDADKK